MTAIVGLEQGDTPEGDHAGTAPGDRRFRSRHRGATASWPSCWSSSTTPICPPSPGDTSVSTSSSSSPGFVITGAAAARADPSTDGLRSSRFYGRRCRRIIPAATLVIVVHRHRHLRRARRRLRQPDRDRRPLDRGVPRQLPLRLDRDQLPHRAPAAFSAAELLVVGRRGAVLSRLPGDLPPCRRHPHPVSPSGPA